MGLPPDHPSRIETGDDWGSPSPLVFQDHKSGWLKQITIFVATQIDIFVVKKISQNINEFPWRMLLLICCKSIKMVPKMSSAVCGSIYFHTRAGIIQSVFFP